jgi:exopolysaccharide biosynthesis polyprenyl glycosylphosphotransferase
MGTAWNSPEAPAPPPRRQVGDYSASVARTIPGVRAVRPPPRKKPAHSVRIDGAYWTADSFFTPKGVPRSALREIAAIAAPTPLTAPDRDHLVKGILADFAVVFVSMTVVHVPLCCRGLGWRQPQDTLFRLWTDLRDSDLGVVLIYGALITLLAYSERVFSLPNDHHAQVLCLCKAMTWATLLVLAGIKLSGAGTISPAMLLASALLNFAGMLCWRLSAARRHSRNPSGSHLRNVLIVGAGRLGCELADWLGKVEPTHIVKGFLDQNRGADPRILGTIEDLPEIARAQFADEVIVALPHDRELAQTAIVAALRNHLDVRLVPDLFGCSPASIYMKNVGTLPVISLHEESIPHFGLIIKRLLDFVVALLALLFLAPGLAFISTLIRLDSAGPVFYRGERVGRKGQRFRCCKFRTMTSKADDIKSELRSRNERVGPIFKISNDPRITRLGRFLRRYSLDELPQLWNVLKGEMSLVGPRPHPVDDFAGYQLNHLRRLDMTPGLTGLWQISARRDPSFQRSMALDLEYIENWSLWMDLQILLKTFPVVLAGTGV